MFKLVACDVDGTLLHPGANEPVTGRTKKTIKAVRELGIQFVLTSARAPRSMEWVAQVTEVGGVAICMNGALIYDIDRELAIHVAPFSKDLLTDVVTAIRAHLPNACFHWEKESSFGRDELYEQLARPLMEHEVAMRTLGDVLSETDPIAKLVVRHSGLDSVSLHDRIAGVVGGIAEITISDPTFVELTVPGITKASALAWVCDRLDIVSSEVIAFGDMTNDIPMLTWAGHGVAVANSHPLLLDIADEVAPSNLEDGVAVVLERLLLQSSA